MKVWIIHNNVNKEIIFRQGRPDDYVSLSCMIIHYLWINLICLLISIKLKKILLHINDYESLNADLDDFIEKVLPNEDVRDYIKILSSCLSGEIREKSFTFGLVLVLMVNLKLQI